MNLRLNALAKMVDPGSRVADIGTDHAYLPIKLVADQVIDYAIASDVAQGPLDNAIEDIRQVGFQNKIEARLGNGLATVKPSDQIDTVVIAGMGGKLMCQILQAAWDQNMKFETLILEPNISEPRVRQWLVDHNYQIVDEGLLFEAGHSYELIKAKKAIQRVELTEKEILFGPHILQNRNEAFQQKWQNQLQYFRNLVINLNKAQNKDETKIASLEKQIVMIEEVLEK